MDRKTFTIEAFLFNRKIVILDEDFYKARNHGEKQIKVTIHMESIRCIMILKDMISGVK